MRETRRGAELVGRIPGSSQTLAFNRLIGVFFDSCLAASASAKAGMTFRTCSLVQSVSMVRSSGCTEHALTSHLTQDDLKNVFVFQTTLAARLARAHTRLIPDQVVDLLLLLEEVRHLDVGFGCLIYVLRPAVTSTPHRMPVIFTQRWVRSFVVPSVAVGTALKSFTPLGGLESRTPTSGHQKRRLSDPPPSLRLISPRLPRRSEPAGDT